MPIRVAFALLMTGAVVATAQPVPTKAALMIAHLVKYKDITVYPENGIIVDGNFRYTFRVRKVLAGELMARTIQYERWSAPFMPGSDWYLLVESKDSGSEVVDLSPVSDGICLDAKTVDAHDIAPAIRELERKHPCRRDR